MILSSPHIQGGKLSYIPCGRKQSGDHHLCKQSSNLPILVLQLVVSLPSSSVCFLSSSFPPLPIRELVKWARQNLLQICSFAFNFKWVGFQFAELSFSLSFFTHSTVLTLSSSIWWRDWRGFVISEGEKHE